MQKYKIIIIQTRLYQKSAEKSKSTLYLGFPAATEMDCSDVQLRHGPKRIRLTLAGISNSLSPVQFMNAKS